jgi:hypothetical protein
VSPLCLLPHAGRHELCCAVLCWGPSGLLTSSLPASHPLPAADAYALAPCGCLACQGLESRARLLPPRTPPVQARAFSCATTTPASGLRADRAHVGCMQTATTLAPRMHVAGTCLHVLLAKMRGGICHLCAHLGLWLQRLLYSPR